MKQPIKTPLTLKIDAESYVAWRFSDECEDCSHIFHLFNIREQLSATGKMELNLDKIFKVSFVPFSLIENIEELKPHLSQVSLEAEEYYPDGSETVVWKYTGINQKEINNVS